MGIVRNIHSVHLPELKAEAERIAVLRGRAIGSVFEATNLFDEAGQYYWSTDLPKATTCMQRAFDMLRQAKSQFAEASDADLRFEEAHKESPRVAKAYELGLDRYEFQPDRFFASRLTYDRRILDLIDHLFVSEELAVEGMRDGNIKAAYTGVSAVARHLVEVASEYLVQLTRDSRITHEVSDTVEMVWAQERVGQERSNVAELVGDDD